VTTGRIGLQVGRNRQLADLERSIGGTGPVLATVIATVFRRRCYGANAPVASGAAPPSPAAYPYQEIRSESRQKKHQNRFPPALPRNSDAR